jgi:hypothetical protein
VRAMESSKIAARASGDSRAEEDEEKPFPESAVQRGGSSFGTPFTQTGHSQICSQLCSAGRPGEAANVDAAQATDDDSLDARRRELLYDTARTLTLSRVRAARGLIKVVKDLGTSIAQLDELQRTIEHLRNIHASLKDTAAEELHRSLGAVVRHSFSVDEPEVRMSFSASVDKVVEMFMIDFPVNDE